MSAIFYDERNECYVNELLKMTYIISAEQEF